MFSETWLQADIPDFNILIPDFQIVGGYKDAELSGKKKSVELHCLSTVNGVTQDMLL